MIFTLHEANHKLMVCIKEWTLRGDLWGCHDHVSLDDFLIIEGYMIHVLQGGSAVSLLSCWVSHDSQRNI